MSLVNYNTGLVLEGGGMRGVFTSGVLDAFMKHSLWFRYVVAVSAGACNGLSYISRQPRRARFSNIDMLDKYEYIGLRHLVQQGCIFDPELLYDKFPNELIPFDWETYAHNPPQPHDDYLSCQQFAALCEQGGDGGRQAYARRGHC